MKKKITLENSIEFIHHEREVGSTYGTFHIQKNLRFVDVNNLESYTIPQLKSICMEHGIHLHRGRKKDYIDLINRKALKDILANNREYNLNKLV